MFRRRRPLMRAAAVGGAAYYAGKKVEEGRQEEAYQDQRLEELEAQAGGEPAAGGISPDAIAQLKQLAELKDQGVLTQEEFDAQKAKILNS
jgi:putative oligomerization/nucleic acid binding protein